MERLKKEKVGIGFNAATGEWVDMFNAGIVDPAKVTRSALQNAASVAAMFLTTEAVVADKPEERKSRSLAACRRHGRHDVILACQAKSNASTSGSIPGGFLFRLLPAQRCLRLSGNMSGATRSDEGAGSEEVVFLDIKCRVSKNGCAVCREAA